MPPQSPTFWAGADFTNSTADFDKVSAKSAATFVRVSGKITQNPRSKQGSDLDIDARVGESAASIFDEVRRCQRRILKAKSATRNPPLRSEISEP